MTGTARRVLGALALLLATSAPAPVNAESQYTPDDTLAAIDQASSEIGVSAAYLTAIVRCETGSTFDPYSIGRHGELGAVQLKPGGELDRFLSWGYVDPFSPWQAVRFLAQRVSMGGASAWSCS